MQFAFVLFRYFPFGGMQRNMMAIANACQAQGHDIEIICNEWQDVFPKQFKITRLGITGSKLNNGKQMKVFYDAFKVYRKIHHYDCVIGFNKFPELDAYYAADSCFATKAYEERSWLYRLTQRAKIYLNYEEAVFDRDNDTHILEVSNKERSQFQKYYQTPDHRFTTLPPGISKTRMAPDNALEIRKQKRQELQSSHNISPDQTILLAIGSGFKTKGLERSIQLLADVISNNDNIKKAPVLLVAGQDKPDSFLRKAKSLKVESQIHFLGGRDDVAELLQAADVVLHPAHKENTGNVLLEAMVAGRPVITTDVCGYAHYVTDADMGVVLQSSTSIAATFKDRYLAALSHVLSISDDTWRERGRAFAAQPEIYSRPTFAANAIVEIAKNKKESGKESSKENKNEGQPS